MSNMDELNAVDCFAALGHPTRLTIYRALIKAGDDGAPVGVLQDSLDIPASTLSHHIKALMQAGLVTQERQGRVLVSRADYNSMRGLIDFLTDDCCQGLHKGALHALSDESEMS